MKKRKERKPTPRTELSDQIRWWDYFNKQLYFRICEIKSSIR